MHNNIHVFTEAFVPIKVLLLSDIHWDSAYCRREILKRHLDEAVNQNCSILLNGDTFDVMGGNKDSRGHKTSLRPEFKCDNYFDEIVNQAIEWFSPYAANIKMIGVGNHEVSVLKNNEIDILDRFVKGLNAANGTKVELGGYGGWIVFRFNNHRRTVQYRIKYHHGLSGGTKGINAFNKMATYVSNADMIWQGHVHEDYEMSYVEERISNENNVHLKNVIMLRTSTYKDEYYDQTTDLHGYGGWATMRGHNPRFIGGRWLELQPIRHKTNNHEELKVVAKTYKTL